MGLDRERRQELLLLKAVFRVNEILVGALTLLKVSTRHIDPDPRLDLGIRRLWLSNAAGHLPGTVISMDPLPSVEQRFSANEVARSGEA